MHISIDKRIRKREFNDEEIGEILLAWASITRRRDKEAVAPCKKTRLDSDEKVSEVLDGDLPEHGVNFEDESILSPRV